MQDTLHQKIKKECSDLLPFLIGMRNQIHQNPELSFKEFNTSKNIQKIFSENNIQFETGFAETGIVATIKGDKAGITRAVRAELDALPIIELNNIDYKSTVYGVMHACGHDVHMTCVLGAAIILNKFKSDLEGTIHFIFQPGEEKLPGGASLMIKEGLFEKYKPEYIVAQHVYPNLLAGQIGICSGQYMASSDEVYITVIGKGGHGALPHLSVDTVLVAAEIIVALQNIVSRNANPLIPSVLTFGKINTDGGATNVIPQKVFIEGTFRTMDEKWRQEAKEKINHIANGIAGSFGAKVEINIVEGYPMLYNDEKITSEIKSKAESYLGAVNVIEIPKRMTSEDFAYFAQKVPCCFYRLGTNNIQNEFSYTVHSPYFNVDEKAIEIGCGLIAALLLE